MQAMRSPIKFATIILVEPMLDARPGNDYDQLRTRLVRSAYKRKDIWNSREEAAAYFSNAVRWHPRILDIFVVSVFRLCQVRGGSWLTGHICRRNMD